MLAQDTNAFIAFFNDIKEKTQQANKEYEALKFKKTAKTNELRQINDQQTFLISGINKNIESLSVLYEYKVFLDSLAGKEFQEELERRKQRNKKRKEEQERLEKMGVTMNSSKGGNQGIGRVKGKQANQGSNANKNDENDVQIPPKLKEVIEESDDDYP